MVTSSLPEHPPTEAAAPARPVPVPIRRRQLSLRGLFLCTTYFAISSALAKALGFGIFVLMNGALLTWLSFRGYLWWMQTNRARPKVYGVGWLIFAVSFALPAFMFRGCGNGAPQVHYGWEAALETAGGIEGVYKGAEQFVTNPEKRTMTELKDLCVMSFVMLFWNLPNLLMLISPFVLYRQQRGKGGFLSTVICCAGVSTWSWGLDGGKDLLVGYYVWSGGITILSLASRPTRQTLLIMGLLGVIMMGISWLG